MVKPPKGSKQFILLLHPVQTMAEVLAVCGRSGYENPQWKELSPTAGMRRFLIYDVDVSQALEKPPEHAPDSTGQLQFCFGHKIENQGDVGHPMGSGSDAPSDQGGTPPDPERGAF